MKRVCIVRQAHYPWQRNVRRNAETLVSQGYEVDVICLRKRGEKKREKMNGVNLYRLPMEHHRGGALRHVFEYGGFFLLASLKLAQLSLKKRYDVIEVHTMPDFLVFVTLFPRLLGSKVILYMFENMPALFISTFKTSPNHIAARLLRFLERASASYAHHVIVSDGLPYKQVLESRGIPSEKITVVLNVPDNVIFDLKALPSGNNGAHFRLIVVSTLVKRYGVQTLIRAMPSLLQDIPELMVDIVGDGEYRSDLQKMASDLGVERHLNFTGQVRHDDVPSYIARADIGLATMIDDVGVPNKLFEYFALGKPSVASALPSLAATFDGDCILYFKPDDDKDLATRVLELYHSPEMRAQIGSRAQAFYRTCQWQATKQKYLEIYKRLLN